MGSDVVDKPEPRHSFASRGRRPLRVPIAEIPRARLLEETATPSNGNGHAPYSSPPEAVTDPAMDDSVEIDGDPTEPTFFTEPDPLGSEPPVEAEEVASVAGAGDLSDPAIDVSFTDPPPTPQASEDAGEAALDSDDDLTVEIDSERPTELAPPPEVVQESLGPPPVQPRQSVVPGEPRFSEPPEELFLDDADVLSRSDIAPAPDAAGDVMIPIPKPPPPPPETSDSGPPEVESDERGMWYENFFGQHYLRTVRTPTPKEVAVECDFIERTLRVATGSRVLDVGCGLGMQTVELASRGYHLVGLDISKTMVSRAKDEAEDRGVQIDFVQGDMREAAFDDRFDALLCWGTTFGYFTERENELVLQQFHQALRPNGALLLEVVNRDFMIGSQPNQVWFEVDGAVCMEETDFDYERSRLRVKRRVASHDGQERDRLYSIRLYALHEMRSMLERNGFRVDEISGREATPGVFFGVESPKMIIRAERLPGPFAPDGNTPPPPVPKGALSEFPPDDVP
ncbi:MAG: methyltransferase domain-containing protein [Myxococcota bacterium]